MLFTQYKADEISWIQQELCERLSDHVHTRANNPNSYHQCRDSTKSASSRIACRKEESVVSLVVAR